MSYTPKYQDYSDFLRSKKIITTKNANSAAEKRKFRALTVFDSYDPNFVQDTGIIRNDSLRTDQKMNDVFSAQQYAASRVPYFNKA